MRKISILLLFIIALSCKEESKQVKTQEKLIEKTKVEKKVETKKNKTTTPNLETKVASKSTTIAFLNNVKSLKKDTSNTPIENFKKSVSGTVKKVIKINKGNIAKSLSKAKEYNYAVIIVENHTIIKIMDLDNCKPSGSWKACMPKGEGYIKKGKLLYQKDYINNIIGLPDNKERLLYLF